MGSDVQKAQDTVAWYMEELGLTFKDVIGALEAKVNQISEERRLSEVEQMFLPNFNVKAQT